jgi:cytoskeleton protein RodZ
MASLGDTLRQARKKRRVAIRDVARETRIDARYLAALEKNELHKLPGGAFDRGYVRSYAQFLGLDPDELAQIYDQEVEKQRRAGKMPEPVDLVEEIRGSVGHRSLPSAPALGWWVLAIAAAAVIGLAIAVWLWTRAGTDARAPSPEPATARVEAEPATSASPPDEEGPPREETPDAPSPDRPEPDSSGASPSPPVASATEPPERRGGTVEPGRPDPGPPISVPESGVGTEVVDRQLTGESRRFEEGGSVYFWTRVVGGEPGQRIRHVWRHEGERVGFVPLELGGSHWRTYSRRDLPAGKTGRWTVEAVDGEGRVLASHSFLCVPSTSRPAQNAPPETEDGPEGA